ncbi:MAG: DegQ family serine endoprotease [Cellvibrionaceae bacterium]|nr:DegQ family serine endoprotease [Cellvibrionaceae bacterium]
MRVKRVWQNIALLFLGLSITVFEVNARAFPEFTALIEDKSPAVVKITAVAKRSQSHQPNMQMPENVPEIFRHFFDPRRMPERNASATGSGFIISSDGYVLTNNHVVDGATEVTVRLIDRSEYTAELVGVDPPSDLALLKINADNLPYLTLADSDRTRVGEWVLAIGSPFGLDYSVSAGIISAIGRSIPADGRQNYVPFIQTDVAINPGNSGGPLFNLDGDVVGINSQIYTRSGGSIGLSFAIPSNLAKDVVAQLQDKGTVDRGWLGVVIQDVDKDLALSFGLERPQGALIAQMERNGPAEKSGLKIGDVILEFNNRKIVNSSDLPYAVGPTRAGSEVPVTIMRKGKKKLLQVKVGTRASNGSLSLHSTPNLESSRLGISVEALSSDLRQELGLDGVVIKQVAPDSAAEAAGVEPGDIIVQLGFDDIGSVKEFQKAEKSLPANKPQPIRVIRRGTPLFRSILIEE